MHHKLFLFILFSNLCARNSYILNSNALFSHFYHCLGAVFIYDALNSQHSVERQKNQQQNPDCNFEIAFNHTTMFCLMAETHNKSFINL